MASSNEKDQFGNDDKKEKIMNSPQNLPNDFSFMPKNINSSFLKENRNNLGQAITSPIHGEEAPSLLFPELTDGVEDEYSELFYIVNPMNGKLEEAGSSSLKLNNEEHLNYEEVTDFIPEKRQKRELTLYEETLLKEFSAEIEKEQKLLAEEHQKKMQLWDLEMQVSQQQHALKMAILREELAKVQQEKENVIRERNAKYLSKFSSGPI